MRAFLISALMLLGVQASARCPECQCMGYLEALRQPPEPTDVALNARVLTGYVPDPSREERFVLRPVGGGAVPVSATTLHVDTYDTLLLTPTAPLAKNTEYELVLLRGANTIPYFKLRTSDGADTVAPTWDGPLEARYVASDGCNVECRWRRGPRVEITAPVPHDDRSGADLVAVWLTTGAPIDYAKPPTGHVVVAPEENSNGLELALGMGSEPAPPPQVTFLLGGKGPCAQESVALPRGAKHVRVGLKLIDRAGNASAPRELLVRLAPDASKRGH